MTYAAYWIRAYILNFVIRSWSLVGVGSGPLRSKLFFRLRRERARIASLVGEGDAGAELLAERFGAPAEKVLSMARRLEARDLSLDTKVFDDGQTTLVDTLESNAQSQEESFAATEEQAQLKERLRAAVEALDPRETLHRRGADDGRRRRRASLAEIGRRLGVSRERARQLESRVKKKLRAQLTSNEAHPRANTRAAMSRRMNTLMETEPRTLAGAGRSIYPALVAGALAIAGHRSVRRARAGGKSELHRARCRVTPGEGDLEESATENKPPRRGASRAR